jgi:hypothetical protein
MHTESPVRNNIFMQARMNLKKGGVKLVSIAPPLKAAVGPAKVAVPKQDVTPVDPQQRNAVSDEARGHYAGFMDAKEASDILRCFDAILSSVGLSAREGTNMLPALLSRLNLGFRHASLLKHLQDRLARPQYAKRGERLPARALVVGGGPIGLRCAIELALLGHTVHVVEKRQRFSRLNVLHLWDWVEYDMIELGIKVPPADSNLPPTSICPPTSARPMSPARARTFCLSLVPTPLTPMPQPPSPACGCVGVSGPRPFSLRVDGLQARWHCAAPALSPQGRPTPW